MFSGSTIAGVVLCLVVLIILADVAYRVYAARQIQHLIENVPPFGVIEDRRDIANEPVTISVDSSNRHSDPDCQLAASVYQPENQAKAVVVFCHELDGNRWTAMHYIEALVDASIAVVSFDFCNHGESTAVANYTPIHWITQLEVTHLDAVLNWVKSDHRFDGLKMGLFGVSRGGCAALIAASTRSDIAAVVTDSVYSTRSLIWSFTGRFSRHVCPPWFFNRLPTWHVWQDINSAIRLNQRKTGQQYLHLEDVVDRLHSNVLMIAGSRDSYVTASVRDQLVAMLPAETESWLVPKAKHNRARSIATAQYDAKIVNHFQQHLMDSSASKTASIQ